MSSIVDVLVNSSACEPCDLPVAGALTYLEWYDKYAENWTNFHGLKRTASEGTKTVWNNNNNKYYWA